MLVGDLLKENNSLTECYNIIRTECSQFLSESQGLPLYKALPSHYSDFQKVKVRFKRHENIVENTFNQAFETPKLAQRAVFAYSNIPTIMENTDLFYVFPINKYKFLYSKEVTNSNSEYKQVIDVMLEAFDSIDKATEIVSDLLKYTYSTTNLYEGLLAQSEVILYGIPYYYAIRANQRPKYSHIIT